MRYEVALNAYDMLDKVSVTVIFREGNGSVEQPWDSRVLVSEWFSGTGEEDPRKWVRDALLFAAEAL